MTASLVGVDELLQFASGVDWDTVAEDAGVADPQQAIEQSNMIARASAWAANFCEQPQNGQASAGLHATQQTEVARTSRSAQLGSKAWVDRDAFLNFRCDTLPVRTIVASAWSYLQVPLTYTPIPAGNWVILGTYPQQLRIVESSQDWTVVRQNPCLIQVTYVSGWMNAVLTGPVAAGANVIAPVDTSLGAQVGDTVTIYDGANTEAPTVTAVPDATHVTFASLAKGHGSGIAVTEVPFDIRHAVLLACTWAAKHPRGVEVLSMRSSGVEGGGGGGAKGAGGDELAEAEVLLEPFVRRF